MPVAREILGNHLNSELVAQLLYDLLDFATGLQAFTGDQHLRSSIELPGCTGVCISSLASLLDHTLNSTVHQFVDDELSGLYGSVFSATPSEDLSELQRLFPVQGQTHDLPGPQGQPNWIARHLCLLARERYV
jgi:hypothetical protein